MELTEAKPIFPYLSFYKAVGNIAVPTTGIALLVTVALQLSRALPLPVCSPQANIQHS